MKPGWFLERKNPKHLEQTFFASPDIPSVIAESAIELETDVSQSLNPLRNSFFLISVELG
jgi:hypothetical protein